MIAPAEVVAAANMLARHGLVTAFGHVSTRVADDRFAITPPVALGTVDGSTELIEVEIAAATLPSGAPGETWMHVAIYRARPDVTAVARAQPPASHPGSALPGPLVPAHGQGAWLGSPLAVYDDARLVRTETAGAAVAGALGAAPAVLLRGNGAVAVGTDPREAATAHWVIEQTCSHLLRVASVAAHRLTDDEISAWRTTWPELWPRLWAYLDSGLRELPGATR
jgi:HCOMODA/2-hydroxy-3-carboxy-muconic semialdehyde decarboxylase